MEDTCRSICEVGIHLHQRHRASYSKAKRKALYLETTLVDHLCKNKSKVRSSTPLLSYILSIQIQF